jgi:hypothetical protein
MRLETDTDRSKDIGRMVSGGAAGATAATGEVSQRCSGGRAYGGMSRDFAADTAATTGDATGYPDVAIAVAKALMLKLHYASIHCD